MGVGKAEADKNNPFVAANAEFLPFSENRCILPDNTIVKKIDACLGVEGIPMSATGQTALFTGINAPGLLNRHKDSYPDNFMRKIIKQDNILSSLSRNGFKVRFLNVYPDHSEYYTPAYIRIQDNGQLYFSERFPANKRATLSVTSCMMLASGLTPFGITDIRHERSIFHDFSNRSLIEQGYDLPEFTPEKAAEIIYKTSRNYDFTLYEFFQTDFYGHGSPFAECIKLIRELDRLVKHLISLLNNEQDTLLITSDHGNLEDFSTQLHTRNPVPLICWGYKSTELQERIDSLINVKPAIMESFAKYYR